jgi:hypothetical protein
MSDSLEHLDEDGRPCSIHPTASLSALLGLATVGARVPAFNHDIASKLQGMMMAIDELEELSSDSTTDIRRALDTATAAMKELGALLAANRALTRVGKVARTTVRDVVRNAANRSGVMIEGSIVDATVECAMPMLGHSLSLVIDVASGIQRQRTVGVESTLVDGHAKLVFSTPSSPPTTASELLVLAAHGLEKERGELRCGRDCIVVRLPVV